MALDAESPTRERADNRWRQLQATSIEMTAVGLPGLESATARPSRGSLRGQLEDVCHEQIPPMLGT